MKKICLITPGHISSNPRLVKEAIALDKAGYKVHLVFTQYLDYLKVEDFKILKGHPYWTYSCLDWTSSSTMAKLRRYVSGIAQKAASTLFKRWAIAGVEKLAINRNYFWQLKEAIKANADLYIAHNLGALPVARAAADINYTKSGFDAEDFHRHETSDDVTHPTVILNTFIEDKYIPGTDHLTAASPLIAEEYKKLFPGIEIESILNVFPKQSINFKPVTGETLKLFWFSQRIGKGRGIEEIIEAIGLLKYPVELHLLGDIREEDKQYFIKMIREKNLSRESFHFYSPISPDAIIPFASQFDIGLATETGIPYNRNICLTNKIFTYIQAGLAVIASDTKAQVTFMSKYPDSVCIYKRGETVNLTEALKKYSLNPKELNKAKEQSFFCSQQLNWEKEQQLFLKQVAFSLT